MSEARRRRGDFVRATTRVLTEIRSGDLLAAATGTRLCEIAATTCGAAWAGLYLLRLDPGSASGVVQIARSPDETGAAARVTAEVLLETRAGDGTLAHDDLLVQAISNTPDGPRQSDPDAAMAFLVLYSPASGRGGQRAAAFSDVDHQRIRILAILAALKEEAAGGTASSDMLARVTQSLMQEPTTDGKLTQLASYLAAATHSDHACIWIRPHAQSTELRLRATHGVGDEARAAARTHDRTLQADLARMSLLNGPAAVATSALPWLAEILGVEEHVLSEEAIVTPIRRSKGVAGVAICSGPPDTDRKSGTTTAMEKQVLLRALADQIALTTEYVRTTLDAQQNARRFALLAAIGEISLAKIGMDEMLDAILARIQEYFDAASCNLYLLGSDRSSLRTRSVQRQDSTNGAARCEIKVTLISGEKTLGTVNLRRAASNPFDEIDHETLQQVAEQMSLALTTSGRYQMQASLAVLDTLTDLPNRRSAEATLQREIERAGREGTMVSIALLDVDHFKSINDTHGHATGDEVLRETARMFKAQLRATDYIARWGGEEFLILLPGSDNPLGPRICERIRHSVSLVTARDATGAIIPITASLGGASFPDHGADLATLLNLADAALYRAKVTGRNRLCWAGEPEPP